MLAWRPMRTMADTSQRLVWSVGALLQAIGDALNARFGACTVRGEVAGFGRAPSGHCYFTLKDADGAPALLRCAMFRRAASLLDFDPADGMAVEVRGRVATYDARGEMQLVVESMKQAGAGALLERFLRLKAALQAEGLFAASRKRPLPPHPYSVGVITSPSAAAMHDVLSALARRAPHVRTVVYPSSVQGPEAPGALVAALAAANGRAEVDLLVVCRGGGSLEDLWAFNDERVVRAIAGSSLPVVCGVGHETDVTLADFAADLRAPTPTAAAELAAPLRDELSARLDAAAVRARRAVHRRLDSAQQRVDHAALRLARPGDSVAQQRTRLAALERGLRDAVRGWLASRRQPVAELAARLGALDPRSVVARGYAIVEDADGELVLDPAQIGGELRLVLARGTARLRVAQSAAEPSPAQGPARRDL
jgi:exodeoxyribonuclease VII large subunit